MRKISDLIEQLKKFDKDNYAYCLDNNLWIYSSNINHNFNTYMGHIKCSVAKKEDTTNALVVQHDLNG